MIPELFPETTTTGFCTLGIVVIEFWFIFIGLLFWYTSNEVKILSLNILYKTLAHNETNTEAINPKIPGRIAAAQSWLGIFLPGPSES